MLEQMAVIKLLTSFKPQTILFLEEIDSEDEFLSHPFKARCNCPSLLSDGSSHLTLQCLIPLCVLCNGESCSPIFYALFNGHSR